LRRQWFTDSIAVMSPAARRKPSCSDTPHALRVRPRQLMVQDMPQPAATVRLLV
jgi:hypothetical protein